MLKDAGLLEGSSSQNIPESALISKISPADVDLIYTFVINKSL